MNLNRTGGNTMKTPLIHETNLAGLKPPKRGKVRDIYDLGETLLIIATDRISAFDVVLPNAVPEKGRVLTQISKYWFSKTHAKVDYYTITCTTCFLFDFFHQRKPTKHLFPPIFHLAKTNGR